ncbi:DUF1648 domain-containing protein [Cohnella nanjingensis]|uniref:DUF1648 domain-containing protein n=1 Tax=Cohnella nanjingensis TaxID=1387779 RepID=A0A7X0RMP7_9BACL|nr:DUF5808 domain-containing protein [Cohnella nanjingensis]MBB6670206.1 DUF1648 domain-containing protein [Cohnella nanjingensis]
MMNEWGWMTLAMLDVITAGTFIVISMITPAYLIFGLYVPEEDRADAALRRLRRRYGGWAVLTGLLGLAAGAAAAMLSDGNPDAILPATLVVQIAGLIVAWRAGRRAALKLKAERGWEAPNQTKRVIDLRFRERQRLVGNGWFAVHLLIIAVCIAVAILQWDRIPDVMATHFGINGEADRFSKKTVGTVFTLNILQVFMTGLFIGINYMIRGTRQNLDPDHPVASMEKQLRFRRANSIFLYALSLFIILLFGVIQGFTLYDWPQTVLLAVMVPLPLLIMGGVIGFLVYLTRNGLDAQAAGPNAKDDRYWRGGGIYFNKNDPALVVEKRYGVGWTFNFAHPLAWVILIGIVLVPIVIVVLTEALT